MFGALYFGEMYFAGALAVIVPPPPPPPPPVPPVFIVIPCVNGLPREIGVASAVAVMRDSGTATANAQLATGGQAGALNVMRGSGVASRRRAVNRVGTAGVATARQVGVANQGC